MPARTPIQHNETVSDIEYIIPRVKSGSVGKNNSHNNIANQYAQSWVFDTDTVGSSQSDSPYNKLPPQFNGSKTVVLKRKQRPMCDGVGAAPEPVAQPVVLVEDTTNSDRQLPFMTSFSRTPSPVPGSDTSSQCSPPAIYECLERLTEPSVYRARLNTAIGTNVDRTSPSVSPRPHSAVMSEQVQYASLMMELNKTIETKFPPKSSNFASQSTSQRNSRRASSRDDSFQKSSTSDAEFSKELEAALQQIHDLESPNTADTPSDGPTWPFSDADLSEQAGKQCTIHKEGNKTIISLTPQKKYTSIIKIVPHENNSFSDLDTSFTKESVESYEPFKDTKELESRTHPFTVSECNTIDSRIIIPEHRKCGLVDKCVSTTAPNGRGRVSLLSKHKSFKEFPAVEFNNNTIDRGAKGVLGRSVSLTEKGSLRPRWSLKTLLKRKPSQLNLTPELESAILKSESLAHLTELELIARYDQNKLLQRQIEEKAWQKITGNSLTDSSC